MISFDFTVRIEDRKFRFSADLLSERIAILGRSGAGKKMHLGKGPCRLIKTRIRLYQIWKTHSF